jgi:hypothetical protein
MEQPTETSKKTTSLLMLCVLEIPEIAANIILVSFMMVAYVYRLSHASLRLCPGHVDPRLEACLVLSILFAVLAWNLSACRDFIRDEREREIPKA